MMDWQPIETAPMDGTSILLHERSHGWIEARFSLGEWSCDMPDGIREYSGDVWVLGDDLAQIEVEDIGNGQYHHGTADGWLPLPDPPERN